MNANSGAHKWVYAFSEGDGHDKKLLGGKGANLCEMTQIGLNVPPGFVITTEACLHYLESGGKDVPDDMMSQVREHMARVEQATGKGFGDPDNPLLVSVRSGSALSMPGMMDTILNLGLNASTLQGEIRQTGDARFGYDAFRRFIQLFGKVAMGVPDDLFDAEFEAVKQAANVSEDVGLSADNLKQISERFLRVFQEHTGRPFPEDPYEQLEIAIKAVFRSWSGKRAVDYRREFKITPDMANGTAVNICTMVFGNRGNDSATGVAFTRNPGTGEDKLYGEYLVNAQGEDVVAGIRTPKPIHQLAVEMPEMARQLDQLRDRLEAHYKEVQDFEFTIERGVLYSLQTRNGKMNAVAMVRTSVEMVRAGLISREQALLRINPMHLEQMLYPRLNPEFKGTPLAQGLPASPGAASGVAVFDADRAELQGKDLARPVILVREETKPEDIHGFFASQGILTSRGGKTSHAAVVARGMGKPCVAGAEGIQVDVQRREAHVGGHVIREGDMITIDGSSGNVYLGQVPMVEPEFSDELKELLQWADDVAYLRVMANADTPADAARALKFGARGIGLCRTERMFNAVDRLPVVIEMIVAENLEQRQSALDRLLPMQRGDFRGLFETMAPRPVTIRLLDPPIHEFLPSERQLQSDIEQLRHLRDSVQGMEVLANSLMLLGPAMSGGQSINQIVSPDMVEAAIAKKEQMLRKVRALTEVNPMLGHRGVRLGITFPEIYKMQIRAILEAEAECLAKGLEVHPQMMVPQVCTAEELRWIKKYVDEIRADVEAKSGQTLSCRFGTMIEVVRACMRAECLAEEADFFSFGTNDLTQAAFSFSREDAENKFLPMYNQRGILHDNPFEVLDTKGVGKLMEIAVQWGRQAKPDLSVGICGEHGGHPSSIAFCHQAGLNYVSCSAPRVPVARLAAAHAALNA
ncbi:MAG TPA: pyruvate, phosphate dikinase [Gammaproteobacteria bacterium]|nr:pyruvate, phosphate dikinase [Gammaproteobacteria bacterium]MCP5430625.1 pyruvate, phosphate dikinase [Chromatiaceae bacterium]MCP5435187.1 pyruvate, phosphate dikinase [Chromatiaceae bacterium]MCW5586274.1 pyruvate, phosphate dikinase [Chromatiales bacterium]HPQ25838.1 pyruvate, phosphate dikinase [Gammaproteobacteria bacterium]